MRQADGNETHQGAAKETSQKETANGTAAVKNKSSSITATPNAFPGRRIFFMFLKIDERGRIFTCIRFGREFSPPLC